MEANKKRKDSPSTTEAAADAESRKPIQVYRIEDVSVSIFANVRQTATGQRTFYSSSFSRSYKTSGGEWRRTRSFDLEDLGAISTLAKQAADYIRSLGSDAEATDA